MLLVNGEINTVKMTGKKLFDSVSERCSKLTTNAYSTSFSMGTRLLGKDIRNHIYNIYGFVRFADEIVDTFCLYNQAELFDQFKIQTYLALENKISLNPILNSFQRTINQFNIEHSLIDTFLHSMEMDLVNQNYNREQFDQYVLGSAEVVGLMCLKVFVKGDDSMYETLKPNAMKLGAAFQKINFLRDIKDDFHLMGRSYFPGVDMQNLTVAHKKRIEEEIEKDFHIGFEGIKKLPKDSRFGVYLAYVYYFRLFKKISNMRFTDILEKRVRIRNEQKITLLLKTYLRHSFNML